MTTIYTSKKTGIAYELEGSHIVEGKARYTLYSEAEQDRISVTESVLKRWYKKSVVVDFTNAEEKPAEETTEETTTEESKPEKKTSKKSGKKTGPRAKTYEEQKWGLSHTRVSLDTFCGLFDFSSVEYDEKSQMVSFQMGADTVARRRANGNELTGSVWFRFKNAEYELTDVEYISTEVA